MRISRKRDKPLSSKHMKDINKEEYAKFERNRQNCASDNLNELIRLMKEALENDNSKDYKKYYKLARTIAKEDVNLQYYSRLTWKKEWEY